MRVAVLGGGLQGACVAMELASASIAVDLYDKNERCVSQASAQNEGKIHLGYVYANDRTRRTARTMFKGALTFLSLMRHWVGGGVDAIPVSVPFHYVVHNESLLGVAEIESHFRAVHRISLDESRGARPDYFGSDYRVPPVRLSQTECESLFDRRQVLSAFRTPEIGIDPEALATLVRARLSTDPNIRCLLRAHVRGVGPDGGDLAIDFEISGSRMRERYDHVVNTLWDGRLAVDRTVGLEPALPWLYRVKHYLRVNSQGAASAIPSTTIVLGPFGDVVTYDNGGLYLSWYPAGMRGASSDLSPPAWPLSLSKPDSDEMRRSIFEGLVRIVPSLAGLDAKALEASQVKAGIIFAWGKTDIHDPSSGLHERHFIGPQSRGRYHTVDTGKLTMAPFFGKMIADRIRQIGLA